MLQISCLPTWQIFNNSILRELYMTEQHRLKWLNEYWLNFLTLCICTHTICGWLDRPSKCASISLYHRLMTWCTAICSHKYVHQYRYTVHSHVQLVHKSTAQHSIRQYQQQHGFTARPLLLDKHIKQMLYHQYKQLSLPIESTVLK